MKRHGTTIRRLGDSGPISMSGCPSPVILFYIPSFERGGVKRLVINFSRELVDRDTDIVDLASLSLLAGVDYTVLPLYISNAVLSLPAHVRYLQCRSWDPVPVSDIGAMTHAVGQTIEDRSQALAQVEVDRDALDQYTLEYAADSYLGLVRLLVNHTNDNWD